MGAGWGEYFRLFFLVIGFEYLIRYEFGVLYWGSRKKVFLVCKEGRIDSMG